MANSVDPDQMLCTAVSYLGLHCLQRPICLNTRVYYGISGVSKKGWLNVTMWTLMELSLHYSLRYDCSDI